MSINQQDDEGDTQLMIAIFQDDVVLVESLLQQGANPNIQNLESDAPLHVAVSIDSVEIIKLLVKAGADIEIRNGMNQTPLLLCLRQLIDFPDFLPEINAVIKALLDAGANPNAQYETAAPALHVAILTNYIETVKLLLEAGADPNLEDNEGNNALIVAIYKGNVEVCQLLIKYGAKNVQGNFLKSPLDWARFYDMTELVQLLNPMPVIKRNCISLLPGRSSSFLIN